MFYDELVRERSERLRFEGKVRTCQDACESRLSKAAEREAPVFLDAYRLFKKLQDEFSHNTDIHFAEHSELSALGGWPNSERYVQVENYIGHDGYHGPGKSPIAWRFSYEWKPEGATNLGTEIFITTSVLLGLAVTTGNDPGCENLTPWDDDAATKVFVRVIAHAGTSRHIHSGSNVAVYDVMKPYPFMDLTMEEVVEVLAGACVLAKGIQDDMKRWVATTKVDWRPSYINQGLELLPHSTSFDILANVQSRPYSCMQGSDPKQSVEIVLGDKVGEWKQTKTAKATNELPF